MNSHNGNDERATVAKLWEVAKSYVLPTPPENMLFISKKWNIGAALIALLMGGPTLYNGLSLYLGGDTSFFVKLTMFGGFGWCWYSIGTMAGYILYDRGKGSC